LPTLRNAGLERPKTKIIATNAHTTGGTRSKVHLSEKRLIGVFMLASPLRDG
jgi:hypothetical protein